jgi:hypothetical protein
MGIGLLPSLVYGSWGGPEEATTEPARSTQDTEPQFFWRGSRCPATTVYEETYMFGTGDCQ